MHAAYIITIFLQLPFFGSTVCIATVQYMSCMYVEGTHVCMIRMYCIVHIICMYNIMYHTHTIYLHMWPHIYMCTTHTYIHICGTYYIHNIYNMVHVYIVHICKRLSYMMHTHILHVCVVHVVCYRTMHTVYMIQ